MAIDLQPEEVRRARDAGIVVPDGLLAFPRERIVRELKVPLDESPEVVLNRLLVLGRWRNDLRVGNRSIGIQPVSVEEDAARRLRAATPGAFTRPRRARLDCAGGS